MGIQVTSWAANSVTQASKRRTLGEGMTQSKIEFGKLVELLSEERHSLKEAEARITQEFSEKIKTELPELDIVLRETKRRGEIAQVTQGYGTPGSTAATIAVVLLEQREYLLGKILHGTLDMKDIEHILCEGGLQPTTKLNIVALRKYEYLSQYIPHTSTGDWSRLVSLIETYTGERVVANAINGHSVRITLLLP